VLLKLFFGSRRDEDVFSLALTDEALLDKIIEQGRQIQKPLLTGAQALCKRSARVVSGICQGRLERRFFLVLLVAR
jgi:hypothetical protein